MNLFKHFSSKDKDHERQAPSLHERLASQTKEQKQRLAGFLSRQAERIPNNAKKSILLVFGACMCALCLFMIATPFRTGKPLLNLAPKPSENFNVLLPQYPENSISHGDYALLVSFRKTLDSLRLHDPAVFQTILKERQGLVDSLDFLIRIYRDQGKALLNPK